MNEMIRVICLNNERTLFVPMGTTLQTIANQIEDAPHPFLAAMVDNRIKELSYRIYTPITVRLIDATSYAGIRVLQRTAWFILQQAVGVCYPGQKLYIRHSMGQSGFYCEVEGIEQFEEQELRSLHEAIERIIRADIPIRRSRMLTEEVHRLYAERGFDDKIELLESCPRLYSDLHTMGDEVGYFYGALAPSSGYLKHFCLRPYYKGFFIGLPLRTDPGRACCDRLQEKMADVFREYQSWVGMMGVPTVGAINNRIREGQAGAMIKIAEAFHERKFAEIADAIYEANRTKGTRLVLISGPSSSGKTTSSKRLSIQLGVLGLKPVMLSLDDYFVDREKTPRDERGEYDFEALEAIDLELFNDHLGRLMRGEKVEIPRYDFITGRRQWHEEPLKLDERSILVIEGIHGLNPRLTPAIPPHQKFRVYISCFTSVAMDNLTRISTTDNRMLRRLIRDYSTRGADALSTLRRFPSVRRGEEKHIFPYQEEADVMLNSSLFYEISVLKPFAEKILREVPDTEPEYDEARRMLKFLTNFVPCPPDEIPPTSVLREFIGGSSFKY